MKALKKYLISGFNTVQDVNLEAGTYTLVAYAKSMYSNVYTFALGDGVNWTEYDIDVIQGQLCKVWLTFTIDRRVTKFKPIANNFSESLPVYVTDLQLTRGNIPVEAGASPLDIDKILDDLHDEIDSKVATSTYTSKITQLDNAITSRVTRTDYDANNNVLQAQFSTIDQRADGIALSVTNVNNKVDDIEIGGKNFLRNFDGRFGTDFWGEGVELVDENGEAIPVYILSVTAPNPISIHANSTPEVPETIKLVLDNGTSVNVPVDWGVIDTSILGEQSIQGIYELPEGVIGDMPEVFLGVLVTTLTVVSVTPLTQIAVDQYKVPSLPTTIQLNLNNQTSIDAPVTWGAYNTNTAGTFELTAVYDLPSGITGYKPTVKMTLVVNAVADTGTFIDVIPYLTSIRESGTDDWGNWIKPNSQYINAIIAHIVAGQSRIYARYRNGSVYNAMLFYYKNATPAFQSSVTLPVGRNYAIGLVLHNSGVFESAEWTGSGDIKLYNLELRNDGSVPPWYIE